MITVFLDPTALIESDHCWDYGEERFRVLGKRDGKVFVVVYTKRALVIRIISARRANRREVKRYEENHSSQRRSQ